MDEVGLGKQLQSVRQKAGYTQQELCNKAEISYSTLAKIERGAIKAPSIFTIERIADTLNVSLDELLGRQAGLSLPPIKPKKTSKNGVRFIYFDINGCLVKYFQHAFTRLSEEANASPDIIESIIWQYNDAVCRGEMTLDELNQALNEALNRDDIDWGKLYLEELEPVKEMHELLAWASEYYHVGLLTNIMPGMINEMLHRGLIPDVPYDAIIDSSQVGAIKPDQEIYEIAQNQSNFQPAEILLVDDTTANVMAAQKMGWKVIWFDDHRPEDSVKRIKTALEFE
jgi:FMN phosphatase YigB (HAD superfamily)/DNA-binding XRE family transcriptional regulator